MTVQELADQAGYILPTNAAEKELRHEVEAISASSANARIILISELIKARTHVELFWGEIVAFERGTKLRTLLKKRVSTWKDITKPVESSHSARSYVPLPKVSPLELEVQKAGYYLRTTDEENQIRHAYDECPDLTQDQIRSYIWASIHKSTGGIELYNDELSEFILGSSLSQILRRRVLLYGDARCQHYPNRKSASPSPIRNSSNPQVLKKGLSDQLAEVPAALWFVMIFMFCIAMAAISTSSPQPSTLERAESKARNGYASKMTKSEAEAFRAKQEANSVQHQREINKLTEQNQARYFDRDLEIYRYMRNRYLSLGDRYNPSIHDLTIARDAATRFGVSVNEATDIYIKIDSN